MSKGENNMLQWRLFTTVVFTTASCAMCLGGQIIASESGGGIPADTLQFGALGLVGYMVYRNYQVQSKKDSQLQQQSDSLRDLTAATINTIHRISDVLSTKKCIAGDQTIKEIKEGEKAK